MIKELERFSEHYEKMTPIVNIYYVMCLNLLPQDLQLQVDPLKVYQKLEKADYLNRKIIFYKLVGKKQPSDFTLISLCLKISVAKKLPEGDR